MDDIVPSDNLFRRIGGQTVGARQVDDLDLETVVPADPLFFLHGLAGPVAHVLPRAGQGVKDGALARVWVASQGKGQFFCHRISLSITADHSQALS